MNPENKEIKELMKRSEVARIIGVCGHTIARMTKRGEIPCIQFNSRTVRYRREDIEALINKTGAV